VIRLPSTTGERKFEVLRAFAFPMKISYGTYVWIHFEHGYLAVNDYHQRYFALIDLELSQCKGEDIKNCEASKPVRSKCSEKNECEYHMYLHAETINSECKRLVSAATPVPVMRQLGAVVLYYMPEPTEVVVRCRNNQSWVTDSLVVEGAGLLNNALACHVTAGNLQLYAHLSGETRVQPPSLATVITSSHQAATSPSEMDALRNIVSEEDTYKFLSTLSTHKLEPTVENLLTLHSVMAARENGTSWTAAHVYISVTVSIYLVKLYDCSWILYNKPGHSMVRRKSRTPKDNRKPRSDAAVPQRMQS